MKEKVLLPLDGSEVGEAAIASCVDVISRFNPDTIEITLLQVISGFRYSVISESLNAQSSLDAGELEELKQEANKYLEEVAGRIRKRNIIVNTMVTVGHAAEEIIRVSQELGVTIIAMSTHGRSGIGRWAIGGITEKVLHHSDIPIVTVRAKRKKANK